MKKVAFYTLIILFLTACVGEDFVESDNLFSARLEIDELVSDTLLVGDTIVFSASYFNTKAEREQVNFVWESSNPEFATINQSGELVGITKGVTVVSVSYEGLRVERLVVVDRLERVELQSSKNSLQENEQLMFSAKYFDKNGVEVNANFNWLSSDLSVATISSSGLLTALKEGQTAISASANGVVSSFLLVTVVRDTISAASIEVTASTNALMVSESLQFTAVVKNINGNVITNAPVNWNSTAPVVLNIDGNGLAMANNVGSSDISASSGNAGSSPFSVLVNPLITTTRMGTFQGRGSYSVNGSVTMEAMPNGNLRLNFANFSSSSGPGLYIYLSNSISGGISIEALNRRTGNFTVDLPSNIGISDYNYVLIWCKPFGLTFGSALLN